MAKNMLMIIPKLTKSELELLCRKMGNISDQELSFCNRFDAARSLSRSHLQLATKICPYWPLVIFTKHLIRLGKWMAIAILVLVAAIVPGSVIVTIAKEFSLWWLLLFIPYIVLLTAIIFTMADYYESALDKR